MYVPIEEDGVQLVSAYQHVTRVHSDLELAVIDLHQGREVIHIASLAVVELLEKLHGV